MLLFRKSGHWLSKIDENESDTILCFEHYSGTNICDNGYVCQEDIIWRVQHDRSRNALVSESEWGWSVFDSAADGCVSELLQSHQGYNQRKRALVRQQISNILLGPAVLPPALHTRMASRCLAILDLIFGIHVRPEQSDEKIMGFEQSQSQLFLRLC